MQNNKTKFPVLCIDVEKGEEKCIKYLCLPKGKVSFRKHRKSTQTASGTVCQAWFPMFLNAESMTKSLPPTMQCVCLEKNKCWFPEYDCMHFFHSVFIHLMIVQLSAHQKHSVLPHAQKAATCTQIRRVQHFLHQHLSQTPELSGWSLHNCHGLEMEVNGPFQRSLRTKCIHPQREISLESQKKNLLSQIRSFCVRICVEKASTSIFLICVACMRTSLPTDSPTPLRIECSAALRQISSSKRCDGFVSDSKFAKTYNL